MPYVLAIPSLQTWEGYSPDFVRHLNLKLLCHFKKIDATKPNFSVMP